MALIIGENIVTVEDIKWGTTQVNRIYLGTTVVWEKQSPVISDWTYTLTGNQATLTGYIGTNTNITFPSQVN